MLYYINLYHVQLHCICNIACYTILYSIMILYDGTWPDPWPNEPTIKPIVNPNPFGRFMGKIKAVAVDDSDSSKSGDNDYITTS